MLSAVWRAEELP
jgi:hypothetical protein